ncbi:MAG: flavodoxin family protein [Candidatus Omnitrophica bacterium]|nr:flavodoxin family protein [Candidatus Omnitrophota bacterium]
MRILLVSSSPHKEKSHAFLLAKEVLKGFLSSVKIEALHLSDFKIEFCRHCESCHRKIMDCPINDDVCMILEKMLHAEGIIFASPNYINQITASMKALWDRSSHFIHCKRFLGKYVVGVVSSGSGQDKTVLDYIRYYAHTCGAQYTGGISSRAPINKKKAEKAINLGNKLILNIQEKKVFPEQIKVIKGFKEYFKSVIQMRKDDWVEEYQYWLNRGWL